MSLTTWKKEFYPIPASQVSEADAIAHSLRKWQGTLREALTQHQVTFEDRAIGKPVPAESLRKTSDELNFNADTCALCRHHIANSCATCPILAYKLSLDPSFEFSDEACEDEYYHTVSRFDKPANTQPMIDLLTSVRDWQSAQANKGAK
jgi:hypothetical protein